MVPAVQNFIVEKMSQQYIEPPTFDLSLSYEDSQHFSPLIFLLSPGADPMAGLYRFAEEKGKMLCPLPLLVCLIVLKLSCGNSEFTQMSSYEVPVFTVLLDYSLYLIAWNQC